MTTHFYSALADGSQTEFDPATDILVVNGSGPVFGGTGPLVAGLFDVFPDFEGPNAGRSIIFDQGDPNGNFVKSIELLFPVSDPLNIYRITSSNITFAGGSVILIGDNTLGVESDDTTTATLNGTGFDDFLISVGGSQTLNGGGGNDRLLIAGGEAGTAGGSGTDVVNGGAGYDSLHLGDVAGMTLYTVNLTLGTGSVAGANPSSFTVSGIEAVDGSIVADHITGDGGDNYIFGFEGADTLDGAGGNDVLYGGIDGDSLIGGAGDDLLDGEGGADSMAGGAGNDYYYVNDPGDAVLELVGGGFDTVEAAFFALIPANVERLKITGVSLVANAADNVIEGVAIAQTFDGAGGRDTVSYRYQFAPVTVNLGLGTATEFGPGNVSVNDSFSNIENIEGGQGGDTLTGNGTGNVLDGGGGVDTMAGGLGADTYFVDNAGDQAVETNNTPSGGSGFRLDDDPGNIIDQVIASVSFALGAFVENLTLSGTAGTSGTGNTLDNVLTGNTGSNTLTGGNGADTLNGAAGADTLVGGSGNDLYVVNVAQDAVTEALDAGTDLVQSTATAYTLAANVENLSLLGTGNIGGTGNTGNNVLTGNAGNNTLNGGAGADTVSYANASAGVTVSLSLPGVAQSTVGAGTDTLIGVENLTGSNFGDTLTGNAGVNVLDGGAGTDTLIGGAGNDVYLVNSTQDVVTEGVNAGTDLVQSTSAAHTLSANVENLTLLGTGNLNGTGNALNNVFLGNIGNNVINGSTGVDTVSYAGMAMGVTVNLALGGAQNTIGGGMDTLLGIENVTGSGQVDALTGNAAANVLDGGASSDTMAGGAGNDSYVVNATADVVTEALNEGTDLVQSTASAYTLTANVENLTLLGTGNINGTGNTLNNILTGNAGNNVLHGSTGTDTVSYANAASGVTVSLAIVGVSQNTVGAGSDTLTSIESLVGSNFNDTLTGNANPNVLNGGLGNDTLTGGAGADSYFFNSTLGATNIDAIAGYVAADDTIRLENGIFTSLTATGVLSGMSFRSGAGITTAADADDFIIYNTTTGQLFYDAGGNAGAASVHFATLTGAPAGITEADFLIV